LQEMVRASLHAHSLCRLTAWGHPPHPCSWLLLATHIQGHKPLPQHELAHLHRAVGVHSCIQAAPHLGHIALLCSTDQGNLHAAARLSRRVRLPSQQPPSLPRRVMSNTARLVNPHLMNIWCTIHLFICARCSCGAGAARQGIQRCRHGPHYQACILHNGPSVGCGDPKAECGGLG
jgi:hypothetical protein